MQAYIQAFINARTAEGCTSKTISWHLTALTKFRTWAESAALPTDPNAWTQYHIRTFVVWLQKDCALSETSVATYVRSLRALLAWMHDEELTTKNIATKVKEPRTPQLQKQPFSNSELRAMLSVPNTSRDRVVLALLIDCGLRASELCNITRADVLLGQRVVIVMGKGQKQRVVPFSTKTGALIRRHLLSHKSDHVTASRTGTALTPNGLLQLVSRLADKAGVTNAYPHRFRHTFAIFYLRNGGDPLTLQRILGHKTLAMTNHYVNAASTDLQRVHDLASPLSHLSKGAKS